MKEKKVEPGDLLIDPDAFYEKYGRKKIIATYTLGCKVNQTETETIEGLFEDAGYEIVDFSEAADVYVVNTCTVTHFADKKSRQMIRRIRTNHPHQNPVIIVMGCYAQASSEEIFENLDVDLVIGNTHRRDIIKYLNKYISDGEKQIYVDDIMKEKTFEQIDTHKVIKRTRAFLKVQEGCNQFCTYCIIPYTRGPIRSKSPEDTISDIKKLVENDFKEVVLTGIHIGTYGQDLDEDIDLTGLIKKILDETDIPRIRISSIEPTEVTKEMISLIKNEDRMAKHLHIPIQSGDDFILKKMNRPYTTGDFKDEIMEIRKEIPDIAITVDVIVGFPYEKEDHFENTFNFIESLNLSGMHVFKYSPRANTPAAKFKEQVLNEDKDKRSRALIELGHRKEKEYFNKFLNTIKTVLVEQVDKEGYLEGHTSEYLKVFFKADVEKNTFVDVKITQIGDRIYGQIIEKQ